MNMKWKVLISLLLSPLAAPALAAADERWDGRNAEPYGPHITTMDQMMSLVPHPNVNEHGIGIYVYDGVNALDAIGPYQVFTSSGLKTFLIGKRKGSIRANTGLVIDVGHGLDEVTQLDVLLVPGGATETAQQALDPVVLQWIRAIDQKSLFTTSVCTGAWILGAAGLLQGRHATTHWYRAQEMLARYGAHYESRRWVHDGKYWTSAGVTAGIDMSLALVNHWFGREYTQAVMLDLQYDPDPPIRGGTPARTVPNITRLMQEMYDHVLSWFL
jgi:transcriptional regulator GlxA family with amidase domain